MATVEENPLAEGLERLPVHPTTLVIFGATGDLAKRKLLPAIYNLAHEGALPERFHLIGNSRTEMTDDEFRELARDSIKQFSRREPDETVLEALVEPMRYVAGSFDDDARLRAAGPVRDEVRRGGRAAVQPRLLPLDGAQVLPRGRGQARRARPRQARRGRGPGGDREADRHQPRRRPSSSTATCWPCSTSPRSSASTTTWARRPSRTCWPFASRTACSSRSGTATTSTTCRSPRRRTSAWGPARATTTPPARCATWCRTTCSSCWPTPAWSRRCSSPPTRCATRR